MFFLANEMEIKLLVEKLKTSDREAFEELFQRFKDPLFQFIFRYIKISEFSEDILQETFLKIWEVRTTLKPELNFTAYLYKISRNLVFHHLKKMAADSLLQQQLLYHYPHSRNDVHLELQWKQYEEVIQIAIAQLPHKRKQVFKLCREENKSYDEVSAILHISKNTVKEHMVLAMKSITSYLRNHDILFGLFFISTLNLL